MFNYKLTNNNMSITYRYIGLAYDFLRHIYIYKTNILVLDGIKHYFLKNASIPII